jgi:hypothetical protein
MDKLVDHVTMNIGAVIILVGGLALMGAIVGLLVWLIARVWITASNRWRGILRAESLIYEHRKNRDEFLQWKEEQDG